MIVKWLRVFLLGILLSSFACTSRPQLPLVPKPKPKPAPTQPSAIKVEISTGGPAVLTTSTAEFKVLPDGYVQAFLLKDGRKLSFDEPRVGALSDSDYAVIGGREVHFILDFQQAQILESAGKMGAGKRVEIMARPMGPSGTELQRVLVIEAYDKFPNVLFASVEYKNTGSADMRVERVIDQRHRLNAKLVSEKAQTWEMWSYHRGDSEGGGGASTQLTRNFSRRYLLAAKRTGESEWPLVAFWTDEVGEAIGDLDAAAITGAIPVRVAADGRVDVQLEWDANAMLKPGESYSSPRNFLCVYAGDASEPQHLLATLPSREIVEPPKPAVPAR